MSNPPQNTPCLSSQEMLDYTQGILSTQEQHRIEKHLLECEFCSDAMEGIQEMENPSALLNIEEELNLEIDSMTSEEEEEENDDKIRVLFPWRMAAAIVLIFVSTFTLWMVIPKNNMQELISEKSVAYPPPSEVASEPVQELKEMQVPNEQLASATQNSETVVSSREMVMDDASTESETSTKEMASEETFSSVPASSVRDEKVDATKMVEEPLAKAPSTDISNTEKANADFNLNEVVTVQKKSEVRTTTSSAQQQAAGINTFEDKDKTQEIYKKGIKEYKSKNYAAAIPYFELCKDKPEAQFYAGVSYFLIDNPHLALSNLEQYIQTNQPTYREASYWYMGLSQLKLDNKSAAKQSFEKVLPFKGEFEKQAVEMLKSL